MDVPCGARKKLVIFRIFTVVDLESSQQPEQRQKGKQVVWLQSFKAMA